MKIDGKMNHPPKGKKGEGEGQRTRGKTTRVQLLVIKRFLERKVS
jgi:hypothetical protein